MMCVRNSASLIALLFGAALAGFGCAEDQPTSTPVKSAGGSEGSDPDENDSGEPDVFKFSAEKEKKLDDALKGDVPAGFHVLTAYFSGGTDDKGKCARWDLEIRGPGIKLAKGKGGAQDLVKAAGKDKLGGKFVSRGAKPGLRLFVKTNAQVRFVGRQYSCNKKDIIDFDVKVLAKELAKPKQLFEGFEEDGDGQSRLQVVIGAEKAGAEEAAGEEGEGAGDDAKDPAEGDKEGGKESGKESDKEKDPPADG